MVPIVKDEINKKFGEAMSAARTKKQVSRHQLAVWIDKSPDTVGTWERGESGPSIDMAIRIARILDFDLAKVYAEPKEEVA